MSLRKRQVINAIIARIEASDPAYTVMPVANFQDGLTFNEGADIQKLVGIHFNGGGQEEVQGQAQRFYLINIYLYHLAWNKDDRLLGVTDGDGILEETDTIEELLDNYRFDAELPGKICNASLDAFLSTQTALIDTGEKSHSFATWGGFTVRYNLEK